jgi:hypothetical protein
MDPPIPFDVPVTFPKSSAITRFDQLPIPVERGFCKQ